MRNFILGTDWWTDCDDAVAVRILARAHKAGEICIKGIAINACMEYSVSSLEGFLNAEEVYNIPLGIDLDATDFGGNPPYQKRLSALSSRYRSNSDACDAVKLYRQILSNSEEKLEIIEIGYLQVIADVLKSGPDDISSLSGRELVAEKVSKFWVMAGKGDEANGKENNFARNERSRAAGHYFCQVCPVPVTFLGWEIGYDVVTGGILDKRDILYKVLCDHNSPNGRSSWDPMLALMAVIGKEEKAGYDVVRGTASVNASSGANQFCVKESGKHFYVVKKRNNEYYRDLIDKKIQSI